MASSSKGITKNKKVIVVKSNDFFALKKINSQKEKVEVVKRNLPDSNLLIPRVCNRDSTSSSLCPIYTQSSAYRAQTSLLKSHAHNFTTPNQQKNESAPNRMIQRKLVKSRSEKTVLLDCRNSFKENSNVKGTYMEKVADDNLDEEQIMDLVNKRYGEALQAQIPFFQEDKVAKGATTPTSKTIQNVARRDVNVDLPPDMSEYKLKEERFIEDLDKEQGVAEDVKNAQKHLETILILDSPEDGYRLFTRQELKNLPDKIFESPPKAAIKQEVPIIKPEIPSPKEESFNDGVNLVDAHHQNIEMEAAILQNLKIKTNDDVDTNTAPSTQVVVTVSFKPSSFTDDAKDKLDKTTEGTVEVDSSSNKNIWELQQKDINFDILIDPEKSTSSLVEKPEKKDIVIADEDTIIFKEMDRFIEEIKTKNKIFDEPQYIISKSAEGVGKIEDSLNVLKISEDVTKYRQTYDKKHISEEITQTNDVNGCVDLINSSIEETNKPENLEKRMQNQVNEVIEEVSTSGILENSSPINDLRNENSNANENSSEILINESDVVTTDTNQNVAILNDEQMLKNATSISHHSNSIQENLSECAILIIKEGGFLESIDLDDVGPNTDPEIDCITGSCSTENCASAPEQSNLNKGETITTDNMNKQEILTLLQKAKGIPYNLSDISGDGKAVEKEKLEHFSHSLKEQIKTLREMYQKLEVVTDSVLAELNTLKEDNISFLYRNLNFIKGVVENSFAKEEKKKLKYKVISINKRNSDQTTGKLSANKGVTKKVSYKKGASKLASNTSKKLMKKTMSRMNKLLNALERNRMLLVMNTRQNAVAKLKHPEKKNFKDNDNNQQGSIGMQIKKKEIHCKQLKDCMHTKDIKRYSKSNESNDTESAENSEETYDNLSVKDKSLRILLEKTDDIIKANPNKKTFETIDQKTIKGISKTNRSTEIAVQKTKMSRKKINAKATSVQDYVGDKENPPTIEYKQETENCCGVKKCSPRYSLRPRKTTSFYSTLNSSNECSNEEATDAMEMGYEVDVKNLIPLEKKEDFKKVDYAFQNENMPCIALYKSTRCSDENFENFFLRNTTRPDYFEKDNTKLDNVTNGYETRSKTLEKKRGEAQMILRSRNK